MNTIQTSDPRSQPKSDAGFIDSTTSHCQEAVIFCDASLRAADNRSSSAHFYLSWALQAAHSLLQRRWVLMWAHRVPHWCMLVYFSLFVPAAEDDCWRMQWLRLLGGTSAWTPYRKPRFTWTFATFALAHGQQTESKLIFTLKIKCDGHASMQ